MKRIYTKRITVIFMVFLIILLIVAVANKMRNKQFIEENNRILTEFCLNDIFGEEFCISMYPNLPTLLMLI
jgi:hypothetical protein